MEKINFHMSHWHSFKMIQMTRVNHINFTCPEHQRVALFPQRNYLSYSNETRFCESSHTRHLVLTWKILFLHNFQENSVTENITGLRNFDFPTMKTFKGERKVVFVSRMAVYTPRYLSLQPHSIHKGPFFKRYVMYQMLIILKALPFASQLCVKICGPSIIHTDTIEYNEVKEKPLTKQNTKGLYFVQKAILFCSW